MVMNGRMTRMQALFLGGALGLLMSMTGTVTGTERSDEPVDKVVQVQVERLDEGYHAACALIELATPIYVENDTPLSHVISSASVYETATGQVISITNLSVEREEQRYLSFGCLPLTADYRVEVTIAYHPEGQLSLCPKQLHIDDLKEFVARK